MGGVTRTATANPIELSEEPRVPLSPSNVSSPQVGTLSNRNWDTFEARQPYVDLVVPALQVFFRGGKLAPLEVGQSVRLFQSHARKVALPKACLLSSLDRQPNIKKKVQVVVRNKVGAIWV